MASKYTIKFDNGEEFQFARKDRCMKLADARKGEGWELFSPSENLVDWRVAQVKAEEPKPVSKHLSAERTFQGSYSIAMVEFVRILASIEYKVEVEEFRKSDMLRQVFIQGSRKDVESFLELLDPLTEAVMKELVLWQKTTVAERRGMTDMQKYLMHRKFITDFAHEVKSITVGESK